MGELEYLELFYYGKRAKKGEKIAMLKIIDKKKKLIKKVSVGDEDKYQYIILKLIESVKKYNFY